MSVESTKSPWLLRIRRQGAIARSAWLLAVCAASGVLFGAIALAVSGQVSWPGVVIAGGVCLAGALVSVLFSELLSAPRFLLHRVLLGTLVRMAPPLLALLSLKANPQIWPADLSLTQLGYLFAAFYTVLLTAETLLTMPVRTPLRHPAAS